MKCAACGTENNSGAKFCRGCGGSLAAPAATNAPAASGRSCPSCGADNSKSTKYCAKCGMSFVSAPASSADSPRASAQDAGRVASGRKGVVWIVGALVAIAGVGGYAWYQHVEAGRATEEKAPAETARRVEDQPAAGKQAKEREEQARTEPEGKVQHEKQQAETATKAAPAAAPKQAAQAKQNTAAATPVAWASECSSLPEGLKKTWCEERAKEKHCGANPRTPECR